MAAAKIRVSDIAKRMGKSEKDVIFQLQSLGAEVTDPSQVLEPEVIQALITGKKLVTRTRSVIMREDKPQPEKKKEAVRPPRPIVKPAPRVKKEAEPKEEPTAAPAPPPVIIPEFIQAAEAEERAAKEAPEEKPKVAAKAPSVAPPIAAAPGGIAGATSRPAARTGPTGPRARTAPSPSRPNYAGQQPAPNFRPVAPRPAGLAARPAGAATRPTTTRPASAGAGMRAAGPGLRPAGGRPMAPPPPPPPTGGLGARRKKTTDLAEEGREKKKPAGKGVKKDRMVEVDDALFTKGPFSGTQIIADDLGPDIVMPEPIEEEEKKHAPSARRDTRKQAAPVSAKVLEFKKPTGKVALSEGVTVKELADKLGVKANDLMKHLLMKKGLMVSINQPLGADLTLEIAKDLDIEAEIVSFEEAVELQAMEKSTTTGTTPRGPVITVMGHVDHGKTSLLDAIRETNVAAGEAGGITQHIGAYQVEKKGRKIAFLDTPGHEAFTMMRARGAKVTDIVILVVAADDGVMPQTKEAIDHARAAKVPMIVAINKIDKPNANVDKVRRELADAGVLVEQWGGDIVSVEVSATKKQGIDDLLDMILLTADILDLKANPEQSAKGVVLEAQKEVGRGIVATVLVQDGTLKIGDAFFSGQTWGRVRAMTDQRGERVKEAGPATPVQVTGFDDVPNAGDTLQVLDDETQTRMIGQMRQEKAREAAQSKGGRMSLDQLFQRMQTGTAKDLNVIIKADVQGSVEVLGDTLRKLSTEQVKVNVIHASVGAISTNDVLLATASDGIIVGFNVRPERNAAELAEKEGVDIRMYTVIYNLVDEMKAAMTGLLEPKFHEVFQGRAEVRETFKVPKAGVIAGCMVVDGVIPRTASVRLLRDNRVIYEGRIGSLRHFKNDVSEVRQGFECGIGIEKFQDIKIGDVIEAFKVEKLEPALA
ncbi:MAG TPA: translation initiation factor IF-2 [Thermoanaerobaculia bacterium]|jgi:translation initiation factor IF-2|nr:translation initiation factor IF-2 [Thermoanaerobaculia bacterium]